MKTESPIHLSMNRALYRSASSSNLELFVGVLTSLYGLQPHLSVPAIKPSSACQGSTEYLVDGESFLEWDKIFLLPASFILAER